MNFKNAENRSQVYETWRRLKKSRTAVIGLILIFILVTVAIIAPLLYDYNNDIIKQNIKERMQKPSLAHPFGTDEFGRDILGRIIYGARISLIIGVTSCLLCGSIGIILGVVAAYYGGMIENVIMRFSDILMAIPSILLAIVIVAAFGVNLFNIIIAVGVATIPQYIRITRASVLTVINQEYIEAAHSIGAKTPRILFRHILTNCFAPIMVQATLRIATVIAEAASLSFLGLGVPAPTPEWGAMLAGGRAYMREYPHLVLFPGLAIAFTILSLNLIGDGLRDALDPKLKK
ncbi:MAG: ABC transporter permease [Firmicutes bacterium]|nr:ABC transporter permease [Bacillota bacterium]